MGHGDTQRALDFLRKASPQACTATPATPGCSRLAEALHSLLLAYTTNTYIGDPGPARPPPDLVSLRIRGAQELRQNLAPGEFEEGGR